MPPEVDGRTDDRSGLTEFALVEEGPWYGLFRLAETPAVTGLMQEVAFSSDRTVRIGVHGNVTGKWRFLDDDSVLLYDLKRADGSTNEPERLQMNADLEGDQLAGLEVFVPQGPGGEAYEVRYERLQLLSELGALRGDWQSKKTYTSRMGFDYRIVVRVEDSGEIAYGIFTGRYRELSRGNGKLKTFNGGKRYWFILPRRSDPSLQPLAGEVRRNDADELVMYAPRGIDTDDQQGIDEFETVTLERVDSFSL